LAGAGAPAPTNVTSKALLLAKEKKNRDGLGVPAVR
jgi:hypothetical protein